MSAKTSTKSTIPWFNIGLAIVGSAIIFAFAVTALVGVIFLLQSAPATGGKSFWYISRSTGVLGWLLLTFSVMWGMVQSGALGRPAIPPALAFGLHNFLSLTGLALVTVHGVILLGDSYLKLSVTDIAIPFASSYKPFLMGLGILSFYVMIVLTASFYLRSKIGNKTFRAIHYASYLAYLLGLWHSWALGTDSGLLWPVYLLATVVLLFLLWQRTTPKPLAAPVPVHAPSPPPRHRNRQPATPRRRRPARKNRW